MQTSLGSHTSVLEAMMQPPGLAENLPSTGQLIPLPFHGDQAEHSHGPVRCGSTDGVCVYFPRPWTQDGRGTAARFECLCLVPTAAVYFPR